jgi:hypothetical protein
MLGLTTDGAVHRVSGGAAHCPEHVRVGVERDANGRVAELLRDHRYRHSGRVVSNGKRWSAPGGRTAARQVTWPLRNPPPSVEIAWRGSDAGVTQHRRLLSTQPDHSV